MKFIFNAQKRTCPICTGKLRSSHARPADKWMAIFRFAPRRCEECRTRFYVRRAGKTQSSSK